MSGTVQVAVRDQLPIAGIDLILGNDLAGNRVFPSAPEVTEPPTADVCVTSAAPDAPSVFPACVVKNAQARKLGEIVDISDSFLKTSEVSVSPSSEQKNKLLSVEVETEDKELCLAVNKEQLIKAQQSDRTLAACLSAAQEQKNDKLPMTYLFNEDVLVRKWSLMSGLECDVVTQVVVPKEFCLQVLSLAHDHNLSGHLGVKKTYHRVLQYFFWPGLKSDCQVLSILPNQIITNSGTASTDKAISLCTFNSADSVLCRDLKPD